MTRVKSKSGKFIALLPESLQGGFQVVVTSNGVSAFCSQWPCNHFPTRKYDGEYAPIVFEFESNGDLVGQDPSMDNADGSAVLALCEDAQEFGEKCIERRRNAEVTK